MELWALIIYFPRGGSIASVAPAPSALVCHQYRETLLMNLPKEKWDLIECRDLVKNPVVFK